ncbi:hypothetical protein [Streptomyces sp. NPDC001978]|uniref:hypothetical protein n=1 Tax=Streptomyces sp. NPDC001978 TaxID=3364627 RepID=UPI0036ABDBE4
MAADRGSSRHEAAHILAVLEEAAGVTPAPLLHVQLPYARAVLAADAVAEELFMVALGQDLARWPLVKARTVHAYGQWLRRERAGRPVAHDAALGADRFRAHRSLRLGGPQRCSSS